jgi:hypothetical protein
VRKSHLALLLAFAAAPVAAHDTWLLPRPGAPAGMVEFDLTSAGTFPAPESVVAADRIARSGLRLAGRSEPLQPAGHDDKALRLRSRTAGVGLATAWIETRPLTLVLNEGELAHYLEDIGAEAIRAEWKAAGLRSWRESYVKLAKSLVHVGGPSADASWAEPVGLELEIVPERDPTTLRPDETLGVRVLFRGQPLAGQPVAAVRGGGGSGLRRTDAQGRVSFALDLAGPWMVRATRLERASRPEADWRSWFSTLTFDLGR